MTNRHPEEFKPHLLVLTSTYPRWDGDPEPGFVHELSKRLTAQFRVTVLAPHSRGARTSEKWDGVQVVRYRYAPAMLETLVNDGGIVNNLQRAKWKYFLVPMFLLAQIWALCRLSRKYPIDVIHAHWLIPQGIIAAMFGKLLGRRIPLVVTSHGADLYALKGRLLSSLKQKVVGAADVVSVVSSPMRDEILRTGANAHKVKVLPMGVDLDRRFTLDNTKRSTTDILFVGRLVEKKGLRFLLDAMPAILLQRPDTKLVVAGFGPEEEMLRNQVARLGISSSVEFIGPVKQEDLPALYRHAALFVAPFVESTNGDTEGLGLVTIEAIGCGCPILVGDVPAVGEVLNLSEDAHVLVQPKDTAALAAAVIRVLATPTRPADKVSGLRERVAARFSWDNVAVGYSGILLHVCNGLACGAQDGV